MRRITDRPGGERPALELQLRLEELPVAYVSAATSEDAARLRTWLAAPGVRLAAHESLDRTLARLAEMRRRVT